MVKTKMVRAVIIMLMMSIVVIVIKVKMVLPRVEENYGRDGDNDDGEKGYNDDDCDGCIEIGKVIVMLPFLNVK